MKTEWTQQSSASLNAGSVMKSAQNLTEVQMKQQHLQGYEMAQASSAAALQQCEQTIESGNQQKERLETEARYDIAGVVAGAGGFVFGMGNEILSRKSPEYQALMGRRSTLDESSKALKDPASVAKLMVSAQQREQAAGHVPQLVHVPEDASEKLKFHKDRVNGWHPRDKADASILESLEFLHADRGGDGVEEVFANKMKQVEKESEAIDRAIASADAIIDRRTQRGQTVGDLSNSGLRAAGMDAAAEHEAEAALARAMAEIFGYGEKMMDSGREEVKKTIQQLSDTQRQLIEVNGKLAEANRN